MADKGSCRGHSERSSRKNKINKLSSSSCSAPDENLRVLIKRGPVSEEMSLKELEDSYARKPEWKVIEEGGVLSIPVEEFRMIDPQKPENFGKAKGKKGTKIENYTVGQTVENLNSLVLTKYNEEKEKAKAAGKSNAECERLAAAASYKLPLLSALKAWQDVEVEIKLKKAVKDMMSDLKIPTLIIRSLNLKAISALKDLGLKLSGDAEIDLLLAYVSGDFLHVVIFEVKRADFYPWQTICPLPNKQAVNNAENQLTKDVDVLMAILAGIPPSQIIFHTLACFPDDSSSQLQAVFCADCLKSRVVCHEDLADLSLLQKKTQVPDKPNPATTSGKKYHLTLSARCLSHLSLLHIGYRELGDKEKLVTERHRYSLKSVDEKMMQREFVVASPQQQQVIANFTASSTKRHLVLEGPAGTGKTLVALQVANNLIESATDTCGEAGNEPICQSNGWEDFMGEFGNLLKYANEPLLVVTAHMTLVDIGDHPIMKYLDASTGTKANKILKGWENLLRVFEVSTSIYMELLHLAEALAKR